MVLKKRPQKKDFKNMKVLIKTIREKFLKDYELASANEYDDWQDSPLGCLALVILI